MTKRATANDTPVKTFRIPPDIWEEFGDVAGQLNSNRTALVLDFMKWMARKPGAKLPKRPEVPASASST